MTESIDFWRKQHSGRDFVQKVTLAVSLSLMASFPVSRHRETIKAMVDGHLAKVIPNFKTYFPDLKEKSELNWVKNLFPLSETNCGLLPFHLREELMGMWLWAAEYVSQQFSDWGFSVCEEGAPWTRKASFQQC